MMKSGRAMMMGGIAGGAACFCAVLGGCQTWGHAEAEMVVAGEVRDETARWIEAAAVTFARDHRHVRYAIVAARTHDLLVLEQAVHDGGRVTWLLEVPGGMRGAFEVGEGTDARGWVLEQPLGGDAHVAGVYGEVVVESDGDDAVLATVRVSATRRAAGPGEVIAPTHTVWGEYRFEWMDVAMAE